MKDWMSHTRQVYAASEGVNPLIAKGAMNGAQTFSEALESVYFGGALVMVMPRRVKGARVLDFT